MQINMYGKGVGQPFMNIHLTGYGSGEFNGSCSPVAAVQSSVMNVHSRPAKVTSLRQIGNRYLRNF